MELNQPRRSDTTSASSSSRLGSGIRTPRSVQNALNALNSRSSNTGGSNSSNNPGINRVQEQLEQFRANPTNYLNQNGIVPSGSGYQVTEAMPQQYRDQLGLRVGDEITSVNGEPASAVVSNTQKITAIEEAGQARIQLQRGQQQITLNPRF